MYSWPLYELRLDTPLLQLRLPSETELDRLGRKAAGTILDEDERDYLNAWAQLPAGGVFERNFIQYHWKIRGQWRPDDWLLELGVYPRGERTPIGCMCLKAKDLAVSRSVSTGSWLLPAWRGRGLGKEMRTAVLHLAFHQLGALEARSSVHPNNQASLGVSRALGYEEDGSTYYLKAGRRVNLIRLRLGWPEFQPACPVLVRGMENARELFGVPADVLDADTLR